jgi:hypothetical protein
MVFLFTTNIKPLASVSLAVQLMDDPVPMNQRQRVRSMVFWEMCGQRKQMGKAQLNGYTTTTALH